MDSQYIISKMNAFLHEAAVALVNWLQKLLPKVSETWWDDCVMASLSYAQREIAMEKGFTRLSDFDLAALLRIANKSWYDMRTIAFLPSNEREVIREMMNVRNNWAHVSTDMPGKDTILSDLRTLKALLLQIGGKEESQREIDQFITYIERPDSVPTILPPEQSVPGPVTEKTETISEDRAIQPNSLVYLIGSPETKGIVLSIKDLGDITMYEVFVNNARRTFYTGQIAPVGETPQYSWVGIKEVQSYLTSYQINNPSAQSLYSLNAARIDFVPYQFRPALKMIHSDEPRILIADSVGVGKTIEAGLIIKELQARLDVERIAVICPRPLVAERKWELEMKRFDEEFVPIDGPTLRRIISDTDRDGEWPIRYNKAIIPYSVLDSRAYYGDDTKRSRAFGLSELDPAPHFDLVIVDEAHHIRNGSMEKDKAFAYKCTKYFCDHADAVVMLTATPIQTGDDDLFTLLNVLRPDVVIDKKTFEMMSKPNAFISRAIHIVRTAEENWAKAATEELLALQKTQWGDNVIAENPLYDSILQRLKRSTISREDRVNLVSDIESLHSFSTMLNRTRRRDIQDFCVRRPYTVSVEFTDYQLRLHNELLNFEKAALSALHNPRSVSFLMSTLKRQAASCIFGLAPYIRDLIEKRVRQINDDPDIDLSELEAGEDSLSELSPLAGNVLALAENLPEEDPKFERTAEIIREKQAQDNNKIMLFSTFRHTLAYLKLKLDALGYRVGQIDGSVKDELRYELKTRFELPKEDKDALDILLFTEVGSEGLDYQFCDLMINYDLPWNPMRIEQRIGRIDRRGQQSEVVRIYNIITEGTVDADIYYRCLYRIGVFESHIGDCEEILGKVASGIEAIALAPQLTEEERKAKLEQLADNEVREAQELLRLEEEEKELFGFDLTEFMTAQELRRAENPWLSQACLQRLIEQYLEKRIGTGTYFYGDSKLKNLRLSASARGELRNDLRMLPGGRNAVRRAWENYLCGNKPNHAITFDHEEAAKNRDSFFVTAMHPLAKQAAIYFANNDTLHTNLLCYSSTLPAGSYPFSVYAWRYTGFQSYTKLVTVCANDVISQELPFILEDSGSTQNKPAVAPDWSSLESKHARLWNEARNAHKSDINTTLTYRVESLANTHRNRVRMLEQQINDALDTAIRRMRMSELETVQEQYARKLNEVQQVASRADIFSTPLVNGVLTVVEEKP